MALQKRSYKKSEIENFDVNNIPKEFVDYIMKLDSSIQEALLESRKDIADKLGLVFDNTELTDVIDDVNQDENGVDVELPQEDASVSDSDEIESSVVTDENSVEANVGPTIDTSALPENNDDIEEEQEEQNEEAEVYTNETVDKIELDIDEDDDVWECVERLFDKPSEYLSEDMAVHITEIVKKTWKNLGADRKALFKLLSRFSINVDQAKVLYFENERVKHHIECTDKPSMFLITISPN